MACRQCKPTVAAWRKIHVNATICRCSALEILLQKPLHLQFLTKFMAFRSIVYQSFLGKSIGFDKSLAGTRPFYFRNCFNVSDNLFVPAVTTAKTKVDRSLAVLGSVSQFYDATCEQTYEMQSAGLTADECSLAEQMFCSDDVRTPYESAPDDGDFDALRPVLITDSTSEIADDPEKPNLVKFTWRYATNRIAQHNPIQDGIFTEPYDYTFR